MDSTTSNELDSGVSILESNGSRTVSPSSMSQGYFTIDNDRKEVHIVISESTTLPTVQEWEQLLLFLRERKVEIHGVEQTQQSNGSVDCSIAIAAKPPASGATSDQGSLIAQDFDSVSAVVSLERDDKYYFSDLYLEVEDHIYLLPSHRFSNESDWFRKLVRSERGLSEADAILLPHVDREAFDALLKDVCPLDPWDPPTLSKTELLSVAELSFKWKMSWAHKSSVSRLDNRDLTPVEHIQLGLKFGNLFWVKSGYVDLVKTTTPISFAEAQVLGISVVANIFATREQIFTWSFTELTPNSGNEQSATDTGALLRSAFQEELDSYPKLDPFERIAIARQVRSTELLLGAYTELLHRDRPLDVDEFGILGLEVALKMSNTRSALLIYTRSEQMSPLDEMRARYSLFPTSLLHTETPAFLGGWWKSRGKKKK